MRQRYTCQQNILRGVNNSSKSEASKYFDASLFVDVNDSSRKWRVGGQQLRHYVAALGHVIRKFELQFTRSTLMLQSHIQLGHICGNRARNQSHGDSCGKKPKQNRWCVLAVESLHR
jgi:hypothetical protein